MITRGNHNTFLHFAPLRALSMSSNDSLIDAFGDGNQYWRSKPRVIQIEKVNRLLEKTNKNIISDLRCDVRSECQYPEFLDKLSSKRSSYQVNEKVKCLPCARNIINKLINTPVVKASSFPYM